MWAVVLRFVRRIKVETVAWIAVTVAAILSVIKIRHQKKQLNHAEDTINSMNNQLSAERARTRSAIELVEMHNKREDELRVIRAKEEKALKAAELEYAARQKELQVKKETLESVDGSTESVADAINKLRGVQ